jgi:hypothetical protein
MRERASCVRPDRRAGTAAAAATPEQSDTAIVVRRLGEHWRKREQRAIHWRPYVRRKGGDRSAVDARSPHSLPSRSGLQPHHTCRRRHTRPPWVLSLDRCLSPIRANRALWADDAENIATGRGNHRSRKIANPGDEAKIGARKDDRIPRRAVIIDQRFIWQRRRISSGHCEPTYSMGARFAISAWLLCQS